MNTNARTAERGSARLKFILVMAVIGVLIYIGYMVLPVLYQAYLFKDLMQHDVDVASSQGYPATWVKDQLVKSAPEFGVPAEAVISPLQRDNRIEVSVQYVIPIEFPGYTYQYNFDHTVKSTAFLTIK
ncbi:MAG TPA: hypothetical protein DC047_06355 [Blastocatellia bacterium]|nr:hypothetical protein [Blastocatellia bacterium]